MNRYMAGKKKRVLVTGASGFIGRHVVKNLLDRGYKVVAHTNKGDIPSELKNHCERVVTGDIGDSITQQDMLRDSQIVCHLAAHNPSKHIDLKEAAHCYHINALATLKLAEKASEKGVSRFLYFSAGNAYAGVSRPCVESDGMFPYEYATSYLVSKIAAEIYLMNISQRLPIEVIIFRVTTPYGPGEPSDKVIPTFLHAVAQGQPLHLINGGTTTFNFVYVTDVANLTAKAIESDCQGIYNVASGEHTSLSKLAKTIIALYPDYDMPIDIEPETKGAFPGFPPISIEKARNTFNFSPRPLVVGLSDYRKSLEDKSRR